MQKILTNQDQISKMDPHLKITTTKYSNFKHLLPFLKPHKNSIYIALLFLTVTALVILSFGRVIKYLIDFGFVEKSLDSLALSLLCFIIGVLVMAICGYFRSSIINIVAEKIINDIRCNIYHHIIRISIDFFENNKIGDISSRIIADTSLIYNIATSNLSFLLRNVILFLGCIFCLFLTNWKLSLLMLLLIPIAIMPIVFLGKKIKKLSLIAQSSLGEVGSHIEETLNNIKTVQSYSCEDREFRRFNFYIRRNLLISIKKNRLKALMIAIVIFNAFSLVALLMWFGGNSVLKGSLTSGELSSFIFYAIIASTSLASLSQISGQLQTASAVLDRVFSLLEIESSISEKSTSLSLEVNNNNPPEIIFTNVDFGYEDNNKILNNFNLSIKSGQKVAIVGLSGSGKSTILKLLVRFYSPTNGVVSLNNIDISQLSLKELRNIFAYVGQDDFIFSGTIFKNIAYFDEKITKKEVNQIIAKNQAFDFIKKLPKGIDSIVGEKGVKLSGGEKQRIAIARAILKNSPILLFDEATSALDNDNEKNITSLIKEIAQDKTAIIIAHKLSTIIDADNIYFLENGVVAESGTHQELMKMNGSYARIYKNQ